MGRYKTYSCQCEECKQMCKKTPCTGYPEEMEKLINIYGIDKFRIRQLSEYDERNSRWYNEDIITPQIKKDMGMWRGECIFYENGNCLINDNKPVEARYSGCKTNPEGSFYVGLLKKWKKRKDIINWFTQEKMNSIKKLLDQRTKLGG